MLPPAAQFPKVLVSYMQIAVPLVLRESGVLVARVAEPDLVDPVQRAAIVGMRHGDARGTCLVFCSRAILASLHPDKPDAFSAPDAWLDDCCGELTNLIVGYLKRLFVASQLIVVMTPPSLLGADESSYADYAARGISHVCHFATTAGERIACQLVLDDDMLTAFGTLDPDAPQHTTAPGTATAA